MGRARGARIVRRRYLVDTDVLSLYFRQHPTVIQHLLQHLSDEVAVSVITVEQVLGGWYAAVRRARNPGQLTAVYDRLAETMNEFRSWDVIGFSAAALGRYLQLKALRLNVGTQDLRIAATALEWGATVVTRNLSDFRRVPGLACEDWAV